jgi:hypothetical protein
MASLPTTDLRSEAKSYLRDKASNKKWARGGQEPSDHHCHKHTQREENCRRCLGRPVKLGRGETKPKHDPQNKLAGHAGSTLSRKAFRNEVVDAMDGPLAHVSDASEEEEVSDTAPLPAEADFMYSYDYATGPRAGGDILSMAITQAVQRFENKETEQLIHNEYDVVGDKEKAEASTDEDAEYEFVDYAHCH